MWLKFVGLVDRLINGITMYRLMLYYLLGLILSAIGFSATKVISYSPIDIAVATGILVLACWLINKIFAAIFNAPTNPESSIITGLILALVLPSQLSRTNVMFMLAAAGLAMASKYILDIKRKHLFNPVAIAILLTAIGPRQSASWWVGTSSMLPLVIIGGLLVIRKVHRLGMVLTYLISTTLATTVFSIIGHSSLSSNLKFMALYSPVFFLGFVMLTEPYTSPTTRFKQIIYALIVGVIIAPQFHFSHFYSTPEFGIIVGNLFAYLVTSKDKLFLTIKNKVQIARDIAEFSFVRPKQFSFLPGQYMEFTLAHSGMDSRGARRYFTIASSPTEDEIKLGVKFYDQSSSYKEALVSLDKNAEIVASQLGGNFVMPKDANRQLVFIAGGIGITPFRSMIKFMLDHNQHRPVILLYFVFQEVDLAYLDVFEASRRELGTDINYIVTGKAATISKPYAIKGSLNPELIKRATVNLNQPLFYISGNHSFVEAVEEILSELNVSRVNIKTDFFPGYA